MKAAGLAPRGRARGSRVLDGTRQQCSRCGEWSEQTSFPKGRSGADSYYLTYCFACKNADFISRTNADPKLYLTDKFRRTKVRARRLGLPFNLSDSDLHDAYFLQGGLCFYTDIPMVVKIGSGRDRDSCSIDKVTPELGYVRGNIVLCANRVNTIKSDVSLDEMKLWMPTWHQRIESFQSAYRTQRETA